MSRTETFIARSRIAAPAEEVFAWHGRPGALERLLPPWEKAEVLSRKGDLRSGGRVELRMHMGPLSVRWTAVHTGFEEGQFFRDEQEAGPFARWVHTHRVIPLGPEVCDLEDHVEYELPFGALGAAAGGGMVRRRLTRMFAHRHRTTARDLERHRAFQDAGPLRILVTGATGLLGTQLCAFLATGGHEVHRLVRGPAHEPLDISWDPGSPGVPGSVDSARLEGFDAVIHLAGENVGAGRWTRGRKERIRQSRVEGTRLLAETLGRLARPPAVLVSASAVGIYGLRGDEGVAEGGAPGSDFLAEVCQAWEAATEPARRRGIRVVNARLGVVLTPRGGALARMLPAFQLGLGGPVGSGRQVMSWVAQDDVLYALHRAIFDERLVGPMNVVAPGAVTSAEFAHTLGAVLRRPAFLPLPAAAVRLLFGEMGKTLLLGGARVLPGRLRDVGFTFSQASLEGALRELCGRTDETLTLPEAHTHQLQM
ncbi:MAG TPA: TIGR01777 family oxidoreductase [Polyangia bacterium]|nr:TIGR01777 family oxidoreductase [Polyangia bacterium]